MKKYLIIAWICMGWTVKAQDSLKTVRLDEVVITGTKSEVLIEKSGKTIFKLTREDIEANNGKSVSDLLNEVPGVQMIGNFGPLGTNIDYSVRGAASRQTLILIDGVPFNDPSGISQTYDLRLLDLGQVESIEILKGGLSTLYGTGAAAGVINISLKKPSNELLNGVAGFEYGSFNTWSPSLGLGGKNKSMSYSFTGSYRSSDGFSAADDPSGTANFDSDGFESFNLLGKMRYGFSNRFSSGLAMSIDDYESGFDGGAFLDADNFLNSQQYRIGMTPQYNWDHGKIKGHFFYADLNRRFDFPDFFFDPNARFMDEYEGKNVQLDVLVDQNLNHAVKLIGGLNYQSQSYSQPEVEDTSFNILDPYLTFNYDLSNFNFQMGGRLNNHSGYGSNFIWNVNPSYLLETNGSLSVKLLASYATSFVAPSLFQLNSPSFGNLELDPEESSTMEVGVSTYANDKSTLDLVYFYREDRDQIIFISELDSEGNFIGGQYLNQNGELETDGVELSGSYQVTGQLEISGHYTYLNRWSGEDFFRIPNNKYGFSVNYQLDGTWNISATHLYVGETLEPGFPENTVISAYDAVDLFVSKTIGPLTISGSVNNLLDKEYQAISGFNARDRNFSVRLNCQF